MKKAKVKQHKKASSGQAAPAQIGRRATVRPSTKNQTETSFGGDDKRGPMDVEEDNVETESEDVKNETR